MKMDDLQQQRKTPTGAVRNNFGKLDFYQIPTIFLKQLAGWFTDGGIKYEIANWKRGMPLHYYLQSLERHFVLLKDGDTSENHAIAIAWNICCFIWTKNELENRKLPEYYYTVGSSRFWEAYHYDEWIKEWEQSKISHIEWYNNNYPESEIFLGH